VSRARDRELYTARLVLRPIEPGDVDAFASLYADPEVVRYLGDGTTASSEETREWVRRAIRRNESEGWDLRVVELTDTGEFVGRCGIAVHQIEGRTEHEVGYVIARERWGHGYATEAASAMRDHAVEALGVLRLIALIRPANDASKRVARKLGMDHERDVRFHGATTELFAMEV
jgi:RimJ/RimL family protein N-acetyltransferase